MIQLPGPPKQYDQGDQAQTRRIIAQQLATIPPALDNIYTVATLPTAPKRTRAFVTDATAPTFLGTLTGGGAVFCPVFFNGSAWVSG